MPTDNTRILSGCFSIPTMNAHEVPLKDCLACNGVRRVIAIP